MKWWKFLGYIGVVLFFIALWLPNDKFNISVILVVIAIVMFAINGFMNAKNKS